MHGPQHRVSMRFGSTKRLRSRTQLAAALSGLFKLFRPVRQSPVAEAFVSGEAVVRGEGLATRVGLVSAGVAIEASPWLRGGVRETG